MKNLISTRAHGILDYTIGMLLIALPWLFGFADWPEAATVVPVALGITVIVYSLCTDYELGMARWLPIRMHLRLDVLAGIFLAASPWIFNFDEYVFWPHLIVGLMQIAVVMMTERQAKGNANSLVGNRRMVEADAII